MRWSTFYASLFSVFIGLSGADAKASVSAEICGPLRIEGQVGPHDYRIDLALLRNPRLDVQQRRTDKGTLADVEKYHFSRDVETLIRPIGTSFGADLQYLLKIYPNHHRGLVTLGKLVEREKKDRMRDMLYPAECYFERAMRFAKDDLVVRMLYAQYLTARKRNEEARSQLDTVVTMAENNAITLYNAAVLYLENQDIEQAKALARRVYASGFPQSRLRDLLKAQGQWTDDESLAGTDPLPVNR